MSVCIKDQIQNMNLVIGCPVGCPYCYARCNARRFHMTEDFSTPEFFPEKLRLMDNPKPHNYLLRISLTSMKVPPMSIMRPAASAETFFKYFSQNTLLLFPL